MIPINEIRSTSLAEIKHNVSNRHLRGVELNFQDSSKKFRKKRKFAKTPRATDEEIVNSRLKNTRVRLNVGGEVHEVMWKTLKRMPFTRLGLLRKALSHEQIMELCDDYNLERNEYYFDRHPKSFLCVLTMFRTGNLHMIEDLCIINFSEDLEYWGINENLMESCCHHRYHMKRERINEEMKKIHDIHEESNIIEKFGDGKFNQFRKKVWDLMENPQTSIWAQIVAVASIVFILISITCLTLSTLEPFNRNESNSNTTIQSIFEAKTFREAGDYLELHVLELFEVICIMWFTFEYVSRLFACPNKKEFLKSPMNMIDILAILPYYISIAFTRALSNEKIESLISVRKVVQVFRILRVLRILKLARHSTGLQALGYTLQKSYKELGMLVMFIALGVLLFSSLIYFAERDENAAMFVSIPATFWWAIITMTTVGYGDMTPKSALGKFIGSFCCICGVLVIALPIPIIVNNFADYYKDQLRREKTLKRKEDMAKARQAGSILSLDPDDDNYDDDDDEDEITDSEYNRNTRSHSLKSVTQKKFSRNEPINHSLTEMKLDRIHSIQSKSENPSRESIFQPGSTKKSNYINKTTDLVHTKIARVDSLPPLNQTQAYKSQQRLFERKLTKRLATASANALINSRSYAMELVKNPEAQNLPRGSLKSESIQINDENQNLLESAKNHPGQPCKDPCTTTSTSNSQNYLRKIIDNIIPKSYSSSYLKYTPAKSL